MARLVTRTFRPGHVDLKPFSTQRGSADPSEINFFPEPPQAPRAVRPGPKVSRMGVHVKTRPSGHPHTPHAADNQPQEPLLAHPVEAAGTVRRAALGLSASTDYSVLVLHNLSLHILWRPGPVNHACTWYTLLLAASGPIAAPPPQPLFLKCVCLTLSKSQELL